MRDLSFSFYAAAPTKIYPLSLHDALPISFIHPLRAAEDVALVDILSNGRFDLGIGQGYSYHEFNAFNIDRSTRCKRYRENIKIIKRLFTEQAVSEAGEFTQLTNARLSPKPVQQPPPPIWVGARGPKAITRAARDGYNLICTFGKDPAPLYIETLRACGRNPADFRVGQLRMIYLADSEDQAWEECQDHLFHALEFYADIFADARRRRRLRRLFADHARGSNQRLSHCRRCYGRHAKHCCRKNAQLRTRLCVYRLDHLPAIPGYGCREKHAFDGVIR